MFGVGIESWHFSRIKNLTQLTVEVAVLDKFCLPAGESVNVLFTAVHTRAEEQRKRNSPESIGTRDLLISGKHTS